MPFITEWVEPKLFVKYKGVKIYHTYRNDDLEDAVGYYTYTTDMYDTNCKDPYPGKYIFDIRDLPTWVKPPYPPFINIQKDSRTEQRRKGNLWIEFRRSGIEIKCMKRAIRKAINQGIIKADKELKITYA